MIKAGFACIFVLTIIFLDNAFGGPSPIHPTSIVNESDSNIDHVRTSPNNLNKRIGKNYRKSISTVDKLLINENEFCKYIFP